MSINAHIHSELRVYEKASLIKTSLERLKQFHQDPTALSKLTPPPIFVQVKRDDRTSLTEGELEFTLWFGFIPVRWYARHQPGPIQESFADLMVNGPMKYWRHEHIFNPSPNGVILIDRVTFAHKAGFKGLITRLMFDGIPLKLLFLYRHLRTRIELERK